MIIFSLSTLADLLIVASIFVYAYLLLLHRRKRSVPGPYGVPILGYLPFLRPDLHRQLDELSKKHGPIFRLNMGTKPCYVISSPDLIKQIVRENDAVFAHRDPPVSAVIATGLIDIAWAPSGVYWREVRKLFVKQVLSSQNIRSSYSIRREEIRKAIRSLSGDAGKMVEIGEIIFSTEIEVIMSLLWGPNSGAPKRNENRQEFRGKVMKCIDLLGKPNVSDFFPILRRFDLQGIAKEMREVVDEIDKIHDLVIEEKMKQKEDNRDEDDGILGFLVGLIGHDIGDGLRFGVPQIKALLLDMIAGGTDTTSTIVEWVMTELLYHPQIMKKVEEELIRVVGMEQVVEESHLSELRYLDAVVKEVFRLHPPVPFLVPRSPSRSCVIGGYEIPVGSRVLLNVWSVQIDPNLWEDPSAFKPERFLDDKSNFDYMGNSFEYLPFGSGRRICPGLILAERMVMHFVATLIHSFEWRVPDGETIDRSEMFGIVMRKKDPLVAVPYPRLHFKDAYI